MGRKERRRSQRERRRLPLRFWGNGLEGTGFSHDISDAGILLETTHPLVIGQRLHLEIEIGDDVFFAEGTVVRKKAYPRQAQSVFKSAAGVHFVGLREAVRTADAACEETPPKQPVAEPTLQEPAEVAAPPVPEEPPAAVAAEPRPLAAEVDLRDPGELTRVFESEIRHGGLSIEMGRVPDPESEIPVTLWLPDPHGTILVRGSVVKANPEMQVAYLSLRDLDPIRRRILEIIDEA